MKCCDGEQRAQGFVEKETLLKLVHYVLIGFLWNKILLISIVCLYFSKVFLKTQP